MPRPAANDNIDTRPAWYDAELLAHDKFLKMLASKFAPHSQREELVQDTCVRALRRWSHYDRTYKFTTWLSLQMKNVLRDNASLAGAEKRTGRTVDIDNVVVSTPADQEDNVDRLDVARMIPDGREGQVIGRRLLGEDQKDIAADFGVSASRIQQLEARGVAKMRKHFVGRRVALRMLVAA